MNCKEFRNHLIEMQETGTGFRVSKELEHHAFECPSCKLLLERHRVMEQTISRERKREPNPFSATRILQRLENLDSPALVRTSAALRPALVTLGLVAALAAGFLIGSSGSKQKTVLSEESRVETLRTSLFVNDFADEDISIIENN